MENMLESFPFDSSPDVQYDEWGYPRFDRAVGSRCLRDALRKLFTSGVFPSPGNALQISKADGLAVSIAPGACIVDGAIGTVLEPMRVTLADTPPKGNVCYGLMLRADVSQDARAVFVRVAASEPGPTPAPPEPTTGPEHVEIRLGHVTVPNGAADLSGAKVVNEKGLAACPYAAPFDRIDASAILEDFRAQGAEAYEALMKQLSSYFDLIASALDGTTAGRLQNQITSIREEMFSAANLDKKYFSVSGGVKPVVGIAPDAVGTANIEDGAVTAEKLADGVGRAIVKTDGRTTGFDELDRLYAMAEEDGTIGNFQILTTKSMVGIASGTKMPFEHKATVVDVETAIDNDPNSYRVHASGMYPIFFDSSGVATAAIPAKGRYDEKLYVLNAKINDDGVVTKSKSELGSLGGYDFRELIVRDIGASEGASKISFIATTGKAGKGIRLHYGSFSITDENVFSKTVKTKDLNDASLNYGVLSTVPAYVDDGSIIIVEGLGGASESPCTKAYAVKLDRNDTISQGPVNTTDVYTGSSYNSIYDIEVRKFVDQSDPELGKAVKLSSSDFRSFTVDPETLVIKSKKYDKDPDYSTRRFSTRIFDTTHSQRYNSAAEYRTDGTSEVKKTETTTMFAPLGNYSESRSEFDPGIIIDKGFEKIIVGFYSALVYTGAKAAFRRSLGNADSGFQAGEPRPVNSRMGFDEGRVHKKITVYMTSGVNFGKLNLGKFKIISVSEV